MGRKSNIFLLAYAIFLLIVGFFANDGILGQISLGAAVAGICFSISDFCLGPGYELKSELEKYIKKPHNEKRAQELITLEKRVNIILRLGEIMFFLGVLLFFIVTICYNDEAVFFRFINQFEAKATIIAFSVMAFHYWMQDWLNDKKNEIIIALNTTDNCSDAETEN